MADSAVDSKPADAKLAAPTPPAKTKKSSQDQAKPTEKVTWGPLTAVFLTIGIYFVSQVVGSLLLLSYAKLQGWSHLQTTNWVQQIWPQFSYVAIVESFTLAFLWWFLRRRQASFKTLGLHRPKWLDLGYIPLGLVIYFPCLIAAMAALQIWFPQINLDQKQQIGFTGAYGGQLLLVFVSLVVLPPITEEILVRGFLYSGLKSKLPKLWAVVGTSLLFAAAHLEFGTGAPLLWSAAADTFILSLVLIYLREKTGSLWASIGLHMTKNLIAFAALFIFAK